MTAKYRLVFFDVDSTLVTIEGIDVLGGGNPEVARLTEAAMNGEIPLDQVYGRTLQNAGSAVYLVTAGIEQALVLLAAKLKVHLRAVRLRFTPSGAYEDFDRRSPLTRPGGKEIVVRDIRARAHGKAAFVGDGVSDLEAKPAVDLFIGFGGVHTRPRVRENADVFVNGPRLDEVLPYLI